MSATETTDKLKGDENRSRLKGRKDKTFWLIPVTQGLDGLVEDAVRRGAYISKSELIREATRRHLEQLGFSLAVECCPGPVHTGARPAPRHA